MTVKTRIVALKIYDRIKKNPEYAKEVGISAVINAKESEPNRH